MKCQEVRISIGDDKMCIVLIAGDHVFMAEDKDDIQPSAEEALGLTIKKINTEYMVVGGTAEQLNLDKEWRL